MSTTGQRTHEYEPNETFACERGSVQEQLCPIKNRYYIPPGTRIGDRDGTAPCSIEHCSGRGHAQTHADNE